MIVSTSSGQLLVLLAIFSSLIASCLQQLCQQFKTATFAASMSVYRERTAISKFAKVTIVPFAQSFVQQIELQLVAMVNSCGSTDQAIVDWVQIHVRISFFFIQLKGCIKSATIKVMMVLTFHATVIELPMLLICVGG